jgi:hypothetical protein
MQRANADHLAVYSDATYPVGPDESGRITYVHVPPLSPLTGAHNLFIDLAPSDVYALRSGRHNASLPGDRRILLLLHLPRRPEMPCH